MADFGGIEDDGMGDVDMTVPQPSFEFIKASRLMVWSQPALVKFLRDRRHHEEKIRERCSVTGEDKNNVAVSIKSSVEPRILEHLAHYVLKEDLAAITEEALSGEMKCKAGNSMNEHVPDIAKLFAENLCMDLREADIGARISKYFMDFDNLVEDHGLSAWVGRGTPLDVAGRQRMKTRCKLLIEHLKPEVVKLDVERLVSVKHRNAREDDVALYDLVMQRATSQQHYHLIQGEVKKMGPGKGRTNENRCTKENAKVQEKSARKTGKNTRAPPKTGCLISKGSRWARDCPTATEEQKAEIQRTLAARKAGTTTTEPAKHVSASVSMSNSHRVTINEVLDVPFCADSGTLRNIISRSMVEELCLLDAIVELTPLEPLVIVTAAGGSQMTCRDQVVVDLRIETAAGSLHLVKVTCLVLDGEEEEFLLGKTTLKDIGIGIDGHLEQLAGGHVVISADVDDVTVDDPELTFSVDDDDIRSALEQMLTRAVQKGFDPAYVGELRALVNEFADVWRLQIGADAAADVEPMQINLQPDSEPYRSGVRKYAERQRKFLRTYVKELVENGLVRRDCNSRWACAALPVRKPGTDQYRITADYRPVNQMTVPLAGATPNLAAVTQSVKGASGFGQFALFKGFWQLPLAAESQELFSFVTEGGVFAPLRVPQGASDSAMHFQLQMHECFRETLYDSVLVWIDDVLLFAQSPADFVQKLRVFFQILRRRNLKLNAKKSLRQMPLPPTAAALQHFLCAVNWLRDSMVDCARMVGPLQAKLEEVMARRGRRKSQLTGVDLNWSSEEEAAFQVVLMLLETSTKQYFADPQSEVCMFTDASNQGWAVVLTQIMDWDCSKPVTGQAHELMIFAPNKEVKPHVCGKLQRWALKLVGTRYVIEHIKGDDNLWADIVSRWGQPLESKANIPVSVKQVVPRSTDRVSPLRPLQDAAFQWPRETDVRQQQVRHRDHAPADAGADGLVRINGKLWIPRLAEGLLKRLLVVAHCGPQGHRGRDVMVAAMQQRFSVDGLHAVVAVFLRACLLCRHVKGGQLVQRPWGDTTTATLRNECLHMDYLFLGDSYGDTSYVLVLKDELTHYWELVPADTPTSAVAVAAVIDWHKRFGLPETWVPDNGSHFKVEAMTELAGRLKAVQKFVPLQLDTRNWLYLLPVIQSNLHHSPVASLGGHVPVELFTGLPASSLLDTVAVPDGRVPRVFSLDLSEIGEQLSALRTHLQELHADVCDRKERKRLYEMARKKGSVCNFEPGDYVLWSRVNQRLRGNKLLVRWVGPFRVTAALSHSFTIRHLLTGDEYEVHDSRLKRYCDAELDVTAEIRQHVATQGIVLGVRAIVNHRYSTEAKEWQLFIAWRGLEDAENSWEPFNAIYNDMPALVLHYVDDSADVPLAQQL